MIFAAKCVMALLAVVSAFGVALSRQAVHSALFLTCNLLCVAVLYLLMSLHFLGAAQLLVYAGAIMVVFLFAVTVLAPEDELLGKWNDPQRLAGVAVGAVLGAFLLLANSTAPLLDLSSPDFGSLKQFASELFGKYVFPFEGTAFVLLVALVGVVLLGHRRLRDLDRGGPSRD
ncbi:NADH-quinone oxidoreductase subunit J [bacterium]|nr:NADH-quinone oxidoreductase subunit J [bacterium]